jgi:hypothetical protein
VISVNRDSPGSLDYDTAGENGITVIAVGGFSLSRGLTLEGLTVSYFLRNSMMYDTLMQMGRWFGYRADYEDLCRVWMPEEAASWYAHIAEATEELSELKRMEQANATPMQFGLAVRSHPSALMVTARNKMGSGEKHVQVGLSNSFVETTKLGLANIDHNRLARSLLCGPGRSRFRRGTRNPLLAASCCVRFHSTSSTIFCAIFRIVPTLRSAPSSPSGVISVTAVQMSWRNGMC